MSYVLGYTQAIKDGIVKDEEEKQKYLQLISRETQRLQKLLRDLMNLAKLDSEQSGLHSTPIAFAQFIEEVLVKYEPIMKERQIRLEVELDPDPIIMGDEGRVEQVLHNILDNAITYTETGGTIYLTLTQQKEECELIIGDTGRGIPASDIHHVMERFYRVNKARSRFDGGSGLGLSIVKKLVEQQKGKITIESEEQIGTKVSIVLPTIVDEWN